MAKKKKTTDLNRMEIIYFESVDRSNPNGNPDADNAPRTDENGHAEKSPFSSKHCHRMYLDRVLGENILYRPERVRDKFFIAIQDMDGDVRTNVCRDTLDVRLWGSVVTGIDSGSITGPTQYSAMKSIDPVEVVRSSITCCAPAKMQPKKRKDDEDEKKVKSGVMGGSYYIPYALMRGEIFVSPTHAKRPHALPSAKGKKVKKQDTKEVVPPFQGTECTREDIDKLIEAIFYGPEHNRAAGRTGITTERVFVFEHASVRGNGKAKDLLARIKVERQEGVAVAACFEDYRFDIDAKKLPKGVKLWEYYLDDNGDVARKQLK